MKTKEELNDLKNEISTLNEELKELSDDELQNVVGGDIKFKPGNGVWVLTCNPTAAIVGTIPGGSNPYEIPTECAGVAKEIR